MRKTFHLCLSGGDEVIFRDTEDYNRGFNTLAVALYKSDSVGLVESIMATHLHLLVQTSVPDRLVYYFRNSYSKYFNCKYLRRGTLGEKDFFSLEVVGYHHTLAAASYVLRNAVHHGVAPIPYAYPHCSSNSIFRKDMGKFFSEPLIGKEQYPRFLGRYAGECPDTYKMTESGVFTRETVLDIPQLRACLLPQGLTITICAGGRLKSGNVNSRRMQLLELRILLWQISKVAFWAVVSVKCCNMKPGKVIIERFQIFNCAPS